MAHVRKTAPWAVQVLRGGVIKGAKGYRKGPLRREKFVIKGRCRS